MFTVWGLGFRVWDNPGTFQFGEAKASTPVSLDQGLYQIIRCGGVLGLGFRV